MHERMAEEAFLALEGLGAPCNCYHRLSLPPQDLIRHSWKRLLSSGLPAASYASERAMRLAPALLLLQPRARSRSCAGTDAALGRSRLPSAKGRGRGQTAFWCAIGKANFLQAVHWKRYRGFQGFVPGTGTFSPQVSQPST